MRKRSDVQICIFIFVNNNQASIAELSIETAIKELP